MSFQAKRELLAQTAARYQAAAHVQKTSILDEFVAATGYTRKYAIRMLRHPPPVIAAITRPRVTLRAGGAGGLAGGVGGGERHLQQAPGALPAGTRPRAGTPRSSRPDGGGPDQTSPHDAGSYRLSMISCLLLLSSSAAGVAIDGGIEQGEIPAGCVKRATGDHRMSARPTSSGEVCFAAEPYDALSA
jgi:hypothetical protein